VHGNSQCTGTSHGTIRHGTARHGINGMADHGVEKPTCFPEEACLGCTDEGRQKVILITFFLFSFFFFLFSYLDLDTAKEQLRVRVRVRVREHGGDGEKKNVRVSPEISSFSF
jgi:hypothetical protein